MKSLLDILVYLCADVMLLNSLYRLYGIYFDRSGVDRRLEYLVYGVCWLANSLNNQLVGIPMVNALGTSASLLVLTFLYPGRFSQKLVRALGLTCLLMLCEVPVYGLLTALRVSPEANAQIGSLLAQLLLFLISLVLKQGHTPRTSPQISRLYWAAILALPSGTMFLLLLLCREYARLGGVVLLLISCVLFPLNLLTFYVLDRLEEYSAAYYEAELLARQNRAYQAEFELMRQSERQISVLRHDMKNHLAVLREYAAQGRLDKLEQYLNTFDQKLTRPGFVHTGNPDIDSILNYKLGQAEAAGARLELDVKLPEGFTADAFDLNVILGNLLDNAVEALAKSQEKLLFFSLRVDRGVFFLNIINSYDGVTLQTQGRDGPVYRSRKGGANHGLGLSIVQRIVEQYHGQLRIDSTKSVFKVETILYLEK